jgi:hypothetical protein
MADALLKLKQLGFPFEWLALRYGLTPTEVADVVTMRERELEADPVSEITRMMTQGAGPAPAEDMPAEDMPPEDEPGPEPGP